MKIVRVNTSAGDFDGLDAESFHVNDAALYLQSAFYIEEATARDHDSLLLKEIGSDDDIGDSGLIFER